TTGTHSQNPYATPTKGSYQGGRPVDLRHVSDHHKKQNAFDSEVLKIIKSNGLKGDEDVPVYDLTQYFQNSCDDVYRYPLHHLLAIAPRFEGELPEKSIVGVLSIPQSGNHTRQDVTYEALGLTFRRTKPLIFPSTNGNQPNTQQHGNNATGHESLPSPFAVKLLRPQFLKADERHAFNTVIPTSMDLHPRDVFSVGCYCTDASSSA
ncbi:hypothetical protein BDW22DRAFT_1349560, partial [Trametopsis cervina]